MAKSQESMIFQSKNNVVLDRSNGTSRWKLEKMSDLLEFAFQTRNVVCGTKMIISTEFVRDLRKVQPLTLKFTV